VVDSLEKMGIEYINEKTLVNAKRTIMSFGTESKKMEGFELHAFVPHKVWVSQEFKKIIPRVGVRYYLPKSGSENNLDSFVKLDEDEKLKLFRMVIFDNILLGSMGINTSIYKKEDIINFINK